MNKKDKLLTIGQFAAMHGINKKTLMWYDEIQLFKPAVINPENGYRYYNYHQSPVLETILLLRELDVSINEIQNFMKYTKQHSYLVKVGEFVSKSPQDQSLFINESLIKWPNNFNQVWQNFNL